MRRKNTNRLLIIFLLTLIGNIKGYNQVVEWEKRIGIGAQQFEIDEILVDKSQNIFLTGFFDGTADFDPTPSSTFNVKSYDDCAYLVKLDSNTNLEWVRVIQPINQLGNHGSYGTSIALDDSNNIYLGGYFQGTCDFNSSKGTNYVTSNGHNDGFYSKFSSTGTLLWVKTFGGKSDDKCVGLDVNKSGSLCATGYFSDTINMDSNSKKHILFSQGSRDIFIAVVKPNSTLDWCRSIGSKESDLSNAIVTDDYDNIYTCGFYYDSIDMDPSTKIDLQVSTGKSDGFIHKLNASGQYVWSVSLRGTNECTTTAITLLGSDLIVAGRFRDSIILDSASIEINRKAYGSANGFLLKIDTSGLYKKLTTHAGVSGVWPLGMATDSLGSIYTVGYFWGSVSFANRTYLHKQSNGLNDGYLFHADNSLNYVWSRQYGNKNDDYTRSISIYNDKYLFLAKKYDGKSYISKLDKCREQYNSDTLTVCDSMISPSGRKIWKSSGIYFDTIVDRFACTYFYRINLTVNYSTKSYHKVTACFKHVTPRKSYYVSGIYTEKIKNRVGCDSTITFDVTIKRNTFYEISLNSCDTVVSPSGRYKWYKDSTYRDIITNSVGCDSVIIAKVKILTNFSEPYIRTCDSFTSPSGKYKWTKTGDYRDTILNSHGCDSIMSIKLKIDKSTWETRNFSDCEFVESPSKKYKWNETGVYQDTVKNLFGCGLFITAYVDITKSRGTQHVNGCESYTSPSAKYQWTESGKYLDTLTNILGCDSIITTNLIIDKNRTSVFQSKEVLVCDSKDKTYQWLECKGKLIPIPNATERSFIAPKNGSYAVIVSDSVCVDTSTCYAVTSLGVNDVKNQDIEIYPNPTSGTFKIGITDGNDIIKYSIIDVAGKVLQTGETRPHQNVSFHSISGVYFVKVIIDNNTATLPLLLKN